mgnify:CR=1 FL=1
MASIPFATFSAVQEHERIRRLKYEKEHQQEQQGIKLAENVLPNSKSKWIEIWNCLNEYLKVCVSFQSMNWHFITTAAN